MCLKPGPSTFVVDLNMPVPDGGDPVPNTTLDLTEFNQWLLSLSSNIQVTISDAPTTLGEGV